MSEPKSRTAAVARMAIVAADGPGMECCVEAVGSKEVGMKQKQSVEARWPRTLFYITILAPEDKSRFEACPASNRLGVVPGGSGSEDDVRGALEGAMGNVKFRCTHVPGLADPT